MASSSLKQVKSARNSLDQNSKSLNANDRNFALSSRNFSQLSEDSESINDAKMFFENLREPFNLVRSSKRHRGSFRNFKRKIFVWKSIPAIHLEKFFLDSKVQFLDFKVSNLVKPLLKTASTDELFINKVYLDWKPYISNKLAGMTTVYLADFRSQNWKNILIGGYVFKSSEVVNDMSISPGYAVNLRDQNLDRIFRFIVITSGLDCIEGSTFGSLSLSIEYQTGNSIIDARKLNDTGLTLVANDNAITLLHDGADKESLMFDNINLKDVVEAFDKQRLDATRCSAVKLETESDLNELIQNVMKPSTFRSNSLNQLSADQVGLKRHSLDESRPRFVTRYPTCGVNHFATAEATALQAESTEQSSLKAGKAKEGSEIEEDDHKFGYF